MQRIGTPEKTLVETGIRFQHRRPFSFFVFFLPRSSVPVASVGHGRKRWRYDGGQGAVTIFLLAGIHPRNRGNLIIRKGKAVLLCKTVVLSLNLKFKLLFDFCVCGSRPMCVVQTIWSCTIRSGSLLVLCERPLRVLTLRVFVIYTILSNSKLIILFNSFQINSMALSIPLFT